MTLNERIYSLLGSLRAEPNVRLSLNAYCPGEIETLGKAYDENRLDLVELAPVINKLELYAEFFYLLTHKPPEGRGIHIFQ